MPASSETAPMWRSKPSASVVWRNRATVVTNLVKPTAAQPVHAGGLQSRPKSDSLQDFTMAESSRPGYGGMGSFLHGGCGPNGGSPPMMRAACSAGGKSWKRSSSWTGQTAGKTKRSVEKVSASRNRDRQFLVRMMTIICLLLDKLSVQIGN